MLKRIVPLGLCWILLLPSAGFSWERPGHRVVAKIAAKNLSPEARKKIAAILGANDAGIEAAMAAASTWPDEINKPETKTGDWHFVNVPVTGPFAIGTFCAGHNCVIDRIQEMSDRLQMNQSGFKLAQPPSPSRPMTSQELAFLIHLVGDIHQPLHSANNGDRGGNCDGLTTPIKHNDHSMDTTELHAAWDVDEVLAVFKVHKTEDDTAKALFQKFKNGAQVQQLTPSEWAREANDLARKDIYQKLKIPQHTAPLGQCAVGIAKVKVTQQYLAENEADVELQLMRAGIRLSNALNKICAGSGCSAKPATGGGANRGGSDKKAGGNRK